MESLKKFVKRIAAIVCANILKLVFLPFPTKNNKIIFDSMAGLQYSCSPKYLYEYLLENYGDKLEFVWVFNDPDKYRYLTNNKNTIVCKRRTLTNAFHFWQAGVAIVNEGIGYGMPLRKNQLRINTWHGMAYKKVGVGIEANNFIERERES